MIIYVNYSGSTIQIHKLDIPNSNIAEIQIDLTENEEKKGTCLGIFNDSDRTPTEEIALSTRVMKALKDKGSFSRTVQQKILPRLEGKVETTLTFERKGIAIDFDKEEPIKEEVKEKKKSKFSSLLKKFGFTKKQGQTGFRNSISFPESLSSMSDVPRKYSNPDLYDPLENPKLLTRLCSLDNIDIDTFKIDERKIKRLELELNFLKDAKSIIEKNGDFDIQFKKLIEDIDPGETFFYDDMDKLSKKFGKIELIEEIEAILSNMITNRSKELESLQTL